jgi:hypothetical protein
MNVDSRITTRGQIDLGFVTEQKAADRDMHSEGFYW